MMTTMAALMGTLPIALGFGAGAEARRPLGLAVVGGLVVSQLLTLYITPVIYLYMERLRALGARLRRRRPRVEQPAGRNQVNATPVAEQGSRRFHCHANDLVTNDRNRSGDPLVRDLLETGSLYLHPGFAVRVATIPQSLPNRRHEVLNTTQPGSSRGSHVLDKKKAPARFQHPQHLCE